MAIAAQDVKRLRDMTGAGMMDCKEALTENAGDFDAAVDFLRKKGLSKAAKKADRATNEGLVHSIVAADAKSGALVEVNCETDFVARNEQFVGLVQLLTQKTLDAPAGANPDAAWLLAEKFPGSDMTVQDALAAQIAKIGENMRVAHAVRFVAGTNAVVRSYIHPGARVGVLIEVTAGKAETLRNPSFESLVRDMAMQVAAASPMCVTRDQADPAVVEHERTIFRGQMEGSGKPPQVIEKIVEGKLEKYYSEACLTEQLFIRDQEKKVQDVLDETGKALGDTVRVIRFARYALGEGA